MMMFTDLPRELELEILVRVPATSLTQLRSTCKRWYALFRDPSFIKKNLGKLERQFLLKKDGGIYSVSMDLHKSFDPSIEFTGKLTTPKDSEQVVIFRIYQCEGLLLCTTKDNRLVVWNPCNGRTRWIQSSSLNFEHDIYVLGYETNKYSCQSYKILRSCERFDEFEIYDFKSDSWRRLDGITHIWFIKSNGVSLKGNVYWVSWDMKRHFTNKYLLRFDFKRGIFERISLPFQFNYFSDEDLSLSVVREEKLAVLLETSYEMKIWVTDIDEAIQYFVDFSKPNYTNYVESFLVDEEKKKGRVLS